ncbi:MAG: hypothetical protein RL672_127 [Actinomycetota bacterium]
MTCYRHPDREAYVRCQRCERVICPACQVEASVGFLCPECAGGTPTKLAAARRRQARASHGGQRPVASLWLIGITVAFWILQVLPGSLVTDYLVFSPLSLFSEPWRMLTAGFAHDQSNLFHVGLNMYSLYVFGQVLEPLLGRWRFTVLYLLSLLGGSAAVMWFSALNTSTLGASGAIFGLMGAYFVILRKLGAPSGQLMGLIAINLAFGLFLPGVSWEAHVGGLVAGAAVGWLLVNTRNLNQKTQQLLGLVGIFAAILIAAYAGFFVRVLPLIGGYY